MLFGEVFHSVDMEYEGDFERIQPFFVWFLCYVVLVAPAHHD